MKKMTKLFSVVSAGVMLAVCAVPASAITDAEVATAIHALAESEASSGNSGALTTRQDNQQRRNEELAPQLPAPAEIDPADPNYPILTKLEQIKCSGSDDSHLVRYYENDEAGNVVEHWKYVPDEGLSMRQTYFSKNSSTPSDILYLYQPGTVIFNPYKACTYKQITFRDLMLESDPDFTGSYCATMFGVTPATADSAGSNPIQHTDFNSQYEYIRNTKHYRENVGDDLFSAWYYLNEEGAAVIVDIDGKGMSASLIIEKDGVSEQELPTKETIFVPTELPTRSGNVPIAEILPGAYARLVQQDIIVDGTVTNRNLLYFDPLAEKTTVSLVKEFVFGDGDITENGEFSVSDAVYGARMIAEDKTLQVSDAGRAAADMDANGRVDTKDLSLMLDLLAAYNN